MYLDFLSAGNAGSTTDSAGNSYTETSGVIDPATPITYVGDDEAHLPNDPPMFTYLPADADGAASPFVVPGRFAGKWYESYNTEVDDFDAWSLRFIDDK